MHTEKQYKDTPSRMFRQPEKGNVQQLRLKDNRGNITPMLDNRPSFVFQAKWINSIPCMQRKLFFSGEEISFDDVCKKLSLWPKSPLYKFLKEKALNANSYSIDDIMEDNYPDISVTHVDGLNSVEQNMQLEERLGSVLLSDNSVKSFAERIHDKTASISENTDYHIRVNAKSDIGHWGGAKGFKEGREGVNEFVYATTKHFESSIPNYREWKSDYPEQNILYLRNQGVVFDLPIDQVKPENWPFETQQMICNVYQKFYPQPDNQKAIFNMFKSMKSTERSILLKKLRASISTNLTGDTSTFLDARESPYRQHDAGSQFNVVVDQEYRNEARLLQKPILSGPSGTAFRYLKAWRDVKRMCGEPSPTMEEARLVILANLLPPNSHHSYHEIMDGSVGVGGLQYKDKEGYGDILKPQSALHNTVLETYSGLPFNNSPKGRKYGFMEGQHSSDNFRKTASNILNI